MIRRTRQTTRYRLQNTLIFTTSVLVVAALLWSALSGSPPPSKELSPQVEAQEALPVIKKDTGAITKKRPTRPALALDPARFELSGDHYIQRLDDGRIVHLTLIPEIQKKIGRLFDRRKVPHGGLVAIEPATGRVLSMVSRSHANKKSTHFALRAEAPSASVFKLVTAAALLEKAKINPRKKICYSGGRSDLPEEVIKGEEAGASQKCADLGEALGHSINAVIARLAYYNLSKKDLEEMALRFGFNREIPFELPVDMSVATFVDEDLERARTAAGFWNVNLSPFHGALISAAISNDGIMMRPTIVDRIESPDGKVLYRTRPEPWLVVLPATQARKLAEMSEETTLKGTASKVFHKRKDWPKNLHVTGKTGTLSNKRPRLTFTWFVGATPVKHAHFAVGALVANPPKWWIKGMNAASDAILIYEKIREKKKTR